MWYNRGLTCGKLGLRWLHVVLSCVAWGLTHCWCGLLWLCHVARVVRWINGRLPRGTMVGPTCQVLAPEWGSLVDVDQWESATWHSCAEVAQLSAAMWHSLLEVAAGVWAYSNLQIVPRECSIPKLYPERFWSNLSPWSVYLIYFIFSEFILITPLVQKFWNFHQKYLNSWWLLL
jgi:hypothetical protein